MASNISTKSSKSNKSSNELNNNMKQPLQPTKPPKKLVNAPINNVSNDNNNSESIVTPEKKEVINVNMKKLQPRVPPLINRFRGGNNEQISDEIIIEKEQTVGNNIEENNSTEQKEGIKETTMDENNECKEGEIDNSTDNVSCKSNTNESKQTPPTQPQQPPVVTTNTTQPQTQQQQQQQPQPQTQANNNNTATSNPLNINQLNASLLAAQRQFNQVTLSRPPSHKKTMVQISFLFVYHLYMNYMDTVCNRMQLYAIVCTETFLVSISGYVS